MSRSGYVDGNEHLELYRSAMRRAMNGRRGQSFLREMIDALDAMQEKVLIAGELVDDDGDCCAIGAVCKTRGIETAGIDYDCPETVGKLVGIAWSMAAEISYENDEGMWGVETKESRWKRMRAWAVSNLVTESTPS